MKSIIKKQFFCLFNRFWRFILFFSLITILLNPNIKAEDLGVGYIASVEFDNTCKQSIKIKIYIMDYADTDTWANFDISVNDKTIATIKGNDSSGDWNSNCSTCVGKDWRANSITKKHDGLTNVDFPFEHNRMPAILYFTPTEEMIFSGRLTVKVKNLDCETGDSGHCGIVAGSQQEDLTTQIPSSPTNIKLKMDENAKTTITWSEPSGEYFSGVSIERGGIEVTKVSKGTITWTDPNANEDQDEYKLKSYYSVSNGACYVFGPYAGDVATPEPPKVSRPAGLKATTDRCDGKVLVSWDYNGDVEPTKFILNAGGTDIQLAGDIREYLSSIGDHSSKVYKIKAKGPINESEWTSMVTGSTEGFPSKPTSFSASISGNTIVLNWSNVNYESKFTIVRNSSGGTTQFEVNENKTSYTDAAVNGCETYTYELYAANRCTEDAGLTGIKADAAPSQKISPNLSSYITDVDASKAYYPDKVLIEWTVQDGNLTLVDNFKIERRKAGDSNFTTIGTIDGTNTFEDRYALGSVLYEYRVTANLKCENEDKISNSRITTGFRIPFATVIGNVNYENGVNVKGVEVLAEKTTAAIGNSLQFNGGYVSVDDNVKLKPSEFIAVEAWIRPSEATSTALLIAKENNGSGYKLYKNGDDIVFGINVGGNWQTVTAADVVVAGQFMHVAGVKDSVGLKVYINGEVPYISHYRLSAEDIIYLNKIGIDPEIVSMLQPIATSGTVYNDFNLLRNEITVAIGNDQTQLLLPFLTSVVIEKDLLPGTNINSSGSIQHTPHPLIIGQGFNGNIDEIRIWNKARGTELMFNDFNRVQASDAEGLTAYWRCDENFGTQIFDASKSNGVFHKNDGTFFSTVSWGSEIPNKMQLGWIGKTDKNGAYLIPYIPYLGSGETFTLTPRFGQHQFNPGSRTLFLGEGANVAEEKDFTDISSFKVTGTVAYEGTVCGVEGAIVSVDGQPVIKNGKPVYTSSFGEFEIAVPVGNHYVSVSKDGHKFQNYKFPPGPESATFDFQEAITGINFVDQTKVTVTGRIVGGTREGDKEPGLGLSKNNIGVAKFEFWSATDCSTYPVVTDSLTGEYSVELPPMVYLIKEFDVKKNPAVYVYFSEFPEADFSVVNKKQLSSYTFEGTTNIMLTFHLGENPVTATLKRDDRPLAEIIQEVTLEPLSGNKLLAKFNYEDESYTFTINNSGANEIIYDEIAVTPHTVSASYNYRYDLIYRTPAKLRVTDIQDESDFFSEDIVKYEDPASKKMKKFNVKDNPFNYPVFMQAQPYSLKVHAEEYYYNQDVCDGINGCEEAVLDRVPVNDGELIINNLLSKIKNPEPLIIKDGLAEYNFIAGQPTVLQDANFPYRNFSGVFNITYKSGKGSVEWQPYDKPDELNFEYPGNQLHPDDKYFRGYVLGVNPIEGSDFITEGPQMVDMILRDPPGNGSYSFLEKGSTFSYEESVSVGSANSGSINTHVSLGPKWEATALGFTNEVEVIAQVDVGVSTTNSRNEEGGITHEVTTTTRWQTADAPYLPGAPNDLFFGSSTNYVISLADNLSIFPSDFAENSGITTAGTEVEQELVKYKIGINKSLMMAPDGSPTHFIFTADHIENSAIPNLEAVRNSLLGNSANYKSNIPFSHPLYGSNNDDPLWGDQATSENYVSAVEADFDGPSYTFTKTEEEDVDQIRKLNQQIRLWQNALKRNEMEKYNAEIIQNVSYDAGPVYENSVQTTVSKSHTSSFELNINTNVGLALGGYFGGVGAEVQTSLDFERSVGKTTTSAKTESNTFGYVFYDEDEGDYFTVDIKDPGTGTGPVFSVKAGRTMCPCERATEMNYYEPATYLITNSILNQLKSLDVSDDLLKILSRTNKTGSYKFNEIKDDLAFTDVLQDIFLGDIKFNVPQIADRKFQKRFELESAILSIINLSMDAASLKQYYSLITLNLAGKDKKEVNQFYELFDSGVFYLYNKKKRDDLTEEFYLYQDYIYDLSAVPVKNPEPLDASTLRRELPVASITPAIRENVPDDNKAYFTLQMGNMSETSEAQMYEAKVVESSNPDGAIILIDGSSVQRGYEIGPGEYINKTITVAMGRPDVYEYNNLQIIFYSGCELELLGGDISPDAIDTVTFSVHFVPSCTDVDVVRPKNQFIINTEDEHLVDGVKQTKVPILISGYDLNNNLFDKLNFQFKSAADPDWIMTEDFYVVGEDGQQKIPGNYTALEWDISGYPDGEYNLRAKTYCGYLPDGSEMFDLSEVWNGIVDRKAPQIFGTPQPADGILSPNDDIIMEFNEPIYGAKLNEINNFDIRGILNGTELRHDVSVSFRNQTNDFVRIPYGINLINKSFTIEFWMQTQRSHVRECIISQSTDPNNEFSVGLTPNGGIEIQLEDKSFAVPGFNTSSIIGQWHHWAFIYDRVRSEVIVLMDGVPMGISNISANYTGYGDIYLGKSMGPDKYPFKGNIHELRIWEKPRNASAIVQDMLITLSGKETGLIGYWPLKESYGTLAADKVHKRNATVNTNWLITPSGYAAKFNGVNGFLNMDFSDVAFSPEQDFTIEFWFKSAKGENICVLSNGRGDENDVVLYYYSLEDLALTVNVLPLEDGIDALLQPMLNKIYHRKIDFLNAIALLIGNPKAKLYEEQLLRFGKHMPTYWSINTDAGGNFQINNNGKRLKVSSSEIYFDDQWHHFALVVQRRANTRIYLDGELKASEPSTEWNGFGAARLFIGARGLFNPNQSNFQFDQYFNGGIDELRIWSTSLKQTQIQRNRSMRLDGDELGLVAYFPFENYSETMGIASISPHKLDDVNQGREVNSNIGVVSQATDVPNIRMTRASSKVDFDFVAQPNRVAFVLNEPNEKIENCILDITAKNIEDMHGNKMNSPVIWSAFIDRNQVKWGDQQFDLEKEIYVPLTFTTKIINSSGQQQHFTIENLPEWCFVSPKEGTLEPLSYQTVTFTINEGVNVGTFSRDISLKTDYKFDEKLQVNLRVYKPLPADWTVKPQNFEHSMNIIGKISINNVISADPFDMVAAFVNGQCRGVAKLKYIEDYDLYEVFLDVYSNKVYGEYFELHIWDASSGREFRGVIADGLKPAPSEYPDMYEFVDNTIYGTPSVPLELIANNKIIQKIPLVAGWNWLSFNLALDRSKSLVQLLEQYNFGKSDMIKGLTSYSEYYNYWIGTLNFLEPENMYMFKVNHNDTLHVTGVPLDVERTPVPIVQGWNWIGYTPMVNISINDALGLFDPNPGDVIKSQFAFAMYDKLLGWVGTLEYLRPNQGYKYNYLQSNLKPEIQLLYYPVAGTVLKSVRDNNDDITSGIPNWSDYQQNMSLVAVIEGWNGQNTKDQIRAYYKDQLRGTANPIKLGDEKIMYFLTIYGNDFQDELRFEYITSSGKIIELKERLQFKDDVEGNTDSPFVFYLSGEMTTNLAQGLEANLNCEVFPNPFDSSVTFKVNQTTDEEMEIHILSLDGKKLQVISGLNGTSILKTIDLSHLVSGIYMAEIRVNDKFIRYKIVKK